MAYADIQADIAANWFTFSLTPGVAFGNQTFSGRITPPTLLAIDLKKGVAAGDFDLIGVDSGILTNVTPGTTDTHLIDLKALVDPLGNAITTMVKCVGLLLMNFAQDDVSYLTAAPAATNGFSSLFTGTGGIKIPPAHQSAVDQRWKYGFGAVLGANLSAYAVSPTNKGITLTSGSSVSLPYRAIILGRSA